MRLMSSVEPEKHYTLLVHIDQIVKIPIIFYHVPAEL
jgi:hypothetical protein